MKRHTNIPDIPRIAKREHIRTEPKRTREQIAQDVEAFLARGGEIQQCDHTANATYGQDVGRIASMKNL